MTELIDGTLYQAARLLSPCVVGIGKTAFGREIPCAFLGESGPRILVVAGHHAREHLSSFALFGSLRKKPPARCRVAAVLSANPDGAALCLRGLGSAPENRRDFLREIVGESDFALWKANGRGVDLNVNFPAGFGTGKGNRFAPAPQGYVGAYPFSEPENLALLWLIRVFRPQAILTLHTKGEVIYWRFGQRGARLARDRRIAKCIAAHTGFSLAEARASAGGLKDFAVQYLGIPAFTLELGRDECLHPLSYGWAEEMAEQLAGLPDRVAEELVKIGGIE